MLLQHEENIYTTSNINLTAFNRFNHYIADLSLGIDIFSAKLFIMTLVLHLFDIYVLEHFTLVNPYIMTSAIIG